MIFQVRRLYNNQEKILILFSLKDGHVRAAIRHMQNLILDTRFP